jgi:DNA-binding GntR family transcriptional regulator
VLRSLYVNLLDQIESHTLAVLRGSEQPLPEYITSRHALHVAIIDALEQRDRDKALSLIAQHNTSNPLPAALAPATANTDGVRSQDGGEAIALTSEGDNRRP